MLWFLFALGGAISNAGDSLTIKRHLKEIDLKLLAAGTNITASILLFFVASRFSPIGKCSGVRLLRR